MSVEYLLVTFPAQRSVLADGNGVGFTNHILMLPSDEYEITLDGTGYTPASLDVALSGTSMVKPMVVGFSDATAAALTPKGMPAPVTLAKGTPAGAAAAGKPLAQAAPVPKTPRSKPGAKSTAAKAAKKDA
jgi:hypothetical protein